MSIGDIILFILCYEVLRLCVRVLWWARKWED